MKKKDFSSVVRRTAVREVFSWLPWPVFPLPCVVFSQGTGLSFSALSSRFGNPCGISLRDPFPSEVGCSPLWAPVRGFWVGRMTVWWVASASRKGCHCCSWISSCDAFLGKQAVRPYTACYSAAMWMHWRLAGIYTMSSVVFYQYNCVLSAIQNSVSCTMRLPLSAWCLGT